MAKDSSSLILLAGGAAVAYYGYLQGWFASFGLAPAATAATGTPAGTAGSVAAAATQPVTQAPVMPGTATGTTATTQASTQAPPASNTPAVYAAFKAALAAGWGDPALTGSPDSPTASPDVFNYYLVNGQGMSQFGISAGPSSATYFDAGGPDSGTPVSLAAYWAVAGPWLHSQYGLSGVYEGLGAIARRVRGW